MKGQGDMTGKEWNASTFPLYGCLTGIELPTDLFRVAPGISLRRAYVDTFGATMIAFGPPLTPKSPHPGPWAAVRGGFTFEGRVQVEITDKSSCEGLVPFVAIWLIAALLRLRVTTPIRVAVIGNMPFEQMAANVSEGQAVAFENALQQIGTFTANRIEVAERELSVLADTFPVAAKLYHDERFFRALSIYDQARWTPTPEMATVLVWTAIEILFDLESEREKTKAIARALSNYVSETAAETSRTYNVIKSLYYSRGRAIHAGLTISSGDVIQSFRLASTAFQRVLFEGELPKSARETLH